MMKENDPSAAAVAVAVAPLCVSIAEISARPSVVPVAPVTDDAPTTGGSASILFGSGAEGGVRSTMIDRVAVTTSPSMPYAVAVTVAVPSATAASGIVAVYVNVFGLVVAVTVVGPTVKVRWSSVSELSTLAVALSRNLVFAAGCVNVSVSGLLSMMNGIGALST